MDYLNIKNDNSLEISPDKVYNKSELLKKFESFINDSGYSFIKWNKRSSVPYECIIEKENEKYDIFLYLKNITGAGWIQKKSIKRIQVSNVRLDSYENKIFANDSIFLLMLGYYNFDNNPIVVAWDAYRYINHKTVRSAYISVDNLVCGYQKGYLVTTDASQKVWIFNSHHLDDFLLDYREYLRRGQNVASIRQEI